MSKKFRVLVWVFCALPFFVWPQEPAGHWVTLPGDGFLRITGVSSRRLTRERELESAREDAARKALLYRGLTGNIRAVDVSGSGPEGAYMNTETSLEPLFPGDFPALREALRFDPEKDVYRTHNAVFVRFTCPAPGAEPLDYRPLGAISGEPAWTRRPPPDCRIPYRGWLCGTPALYPGNGHQVLRKRGRGAHNRPVDVHRNP
ncbi:MAG: hypothetical protein LBD37_10740 [Treponema sp.]|nr:hypothetical protein [Treponema sp.]